MSTYNETKVGFTEPDYEYGNSSPLEVIRLVPALGKSALDPHGSLEHDTSDEPGFTEEELEHMVYEIVDNYQIIGDPKSTELAPKHFGISIANAHFLENGTPAVLMMSTNGSNLYNEEGRPNNEGNALELAYMAFAHPDKPVVYVESPGNGNSVDLENDEYKSAAKDGRLIDTTTDDDGKLVRYEAFETMQALARALETAGINVGYVSSNTTGAHFSSALVAALPENSMNRALHYNPTNISDRNAIALSFAEIREILTQSKYADASKDPLQLTEERKEMAKEVMSSIPKRKFDLGRKGTHNTIKLYRQQKIFRHGNKKGQAAAVHFVAGQMRHSDYKQTAVFPEFAAHYKDPDYDIPEFVGLVAVLGGKAVEVDDLESLKIPLGQYGHSHYPTVRQTIDAYALSR